MFSCVFEQTYMNSYCTGEAGKAARAASVIDGTQRALDAPAPEVRCAVCCIVRVCVCMLVCICVCVRCTCLVCFLRYCVRVFVVCMHGCMGEWMFMLVVVLQSRLAEDRTALTSASDLYGEVLDPTLDPEKLKRALRKEKKRNRGITDTGERGH